MGEELGTHHLWFDFFYCSSGSLDFDDFLLLMADKSRETDIEIHYKDTFRAFSKDDDGDCAFWNLKEISHYFPGCIPAEELKFVMNHLPGGVGLKEIEEMIEIVDRNGDGRISYSEFRSRLDFIYRCVLIYTLYISKRKIFYSRGCSFGNMKHLDLMFFITDEWIMAFQ